MFMKNQKVGKYHIIDLIGMGGFGSVFLASDTIIERKVAIKVPHQQGGDLEDLAMEARLLAALNHPNIVQVLTAEIIDDVFFIVMEYVSGRSLEDILRENKKLDLTTALDYFWQVCEAVKYAHSRKILHRDLRPANTLISAEDKVKVADFGTSKMLEKSTFAKTRVGSPPYMSPEQFKGRATMASDVYSLGVMLYEMLTGNLPFFDLSPAKIEEIVIKGNVTPPRALNDAIPHELNALILKAMSRTLSKRYRAVEDMMIDLKDISKRTGEGSIIEDIKERISIRNITEEKRRSSCWNCGKPLPLGGGTCLHCGEPQ